MISAPQAANREIPLEKRAVNRSLRSIGLEDLAIDLTDRRSSVAEVARARGLRGCRLWSRPGLRLRRGRRRRLRGGLWGRGRRGRRLLDRHDLRILVGVRDQVRFQDVAVEGDPPPVHLQRLRAGLEDPDEFPALVSARDGARTSTWMWTGSWSSPLAHRASRWRHTRSLGPRPR